MNLKTCKGYFRTFANKCHQSEHWLHPISLLSMALLLFLQVINYGDLSGSYSFGDVVVIKGTIYILAIIIVVAINYAPILWLYMIWATPQAMLKFSFTKVLVQRLLSLIARLQTTKAQLYLWLTRKRPFQSGHYSLASLFSLSVVPYHLYSLSCCQLE